LELKFTKYNSKLNFSNVTNETNETNETNQEILFSLDVIPKVFSPIHEKC
jgi:hypothetical protein